jgi:pimeloyl-ACP methyl ester carboxylesterase
MAAAARFGVPVSAVCGLGIKVRWSEQDLTRAAELAARPRRVFDDRQRAVEGALKVAGLSGLVSGESAVAAAGVVEVDDGWTLAFDPGAFAVGVPNMRGLLAAAQARSVILAAGELDPMCRLKDLLELQSDATVLAGLGHNAHVENPEALLPLIDRLGGLATRRR